MTVICIFGDSPRKHEIVADYAWDYEAAAINDADFDFPTVNERLECVLNCVVEQKQNGNNVVVSIGDDSEKTRNKAAELLRPFCDEMLCVCSFKAYVSPAEGWDEVWISSSL